MTNRKVTFSVAVLGAAVGIVIGAYSVGHVDGWVKSWLDASNTAANAQGSRSTETKRATAPSDPAGGVQSIELNDKQLTSVKVEVVEEHVFPVEKAAVGSIDFNEELTVQVFTPYQGKIIDVFAKVGDEVKQGQTLFTIDSPDLLAADSNLVAAAGVLELTSRNLERLKVLYQSRAVSQHDLEQAVSDQQTAEGALRSARDAVRIFGKTEQEIDKIVTARMADPRLVVPSPISGRVTARNAAPGLLVQPGNAPPPYSVADLSTMWMLANIAEVDVPFIRVGQQVTVLVIAYPGKAFEGRITSVDSSVDPNTHRMLIRSTIDDPNHELRSNMFANFTIRTGDSVRSLAVPLDGVVREGDGTMTVWITNDRRRFSQRTVKIGMQKDGFRQIVEGLKQGDLVATDGAVFLSNMLVIGQTGG